MNYFDVHTHKVREDRRFDQVVSLDIREALDQGLNPEGPFCLGIHPWYIDEIVIDEAYGLIKTWSSHKWFMSLGEIGLDRSIKIPIERQMEVFQKQIEIAKENDVHSMTLHCVRAYPDVLKVIKETNFNGSLIFHDYNGNVDMTEQLLRFNSYFSYGAKLFNESTKGYQSFTHIPNHRLLLETDDMADNQIEEVFQKASELLKMDLKMLGFTMLENAETAFSKPLPSNA